MRKSKLGISILAIAAIALSLSFSMQSSSAATSATAAKCGATRLSYFKYFSKTVSVMCDSTWMYVSSLEIPNDEMMVGITGWNQQVPLPFVLSDVLSTIWKIPLKPKYSSTVTKTTGVGATALMANGVPLFNATKPSPNGDQSSYVASADPKLIGELDNCDGHSGRGDDYHYHAYPSCFVSSLVKLSGKSSSKYGLLGWSLDGFAIYGLYEKVGVLATKLDQCLGHDLKDGRGYHYHFTNTPPYSPMCFHGVLPIENNPEHQPAAAPLRQAGAPAKVLITEMHFDLQGKSTLSYDYAGGSGSVSYWPVDSSDPAKQCWKFEYTNPLPGSPSSTNQTSCRNKNGRNG